MNFKESEDRIRIFYDQKYYGEYRQKGFVLRKTPFLNYYGQFLDFLDVETGKRILDIACGTGGLLAEAEKRNLQCYGIDISQTAISQARKRLRSKKNLVCKTVEDELPYSDKFFNYITCLGSLEHFQNQSFVVKEISRISKDEGKICTLVPNDDYILHKFGYETDAQLVVNHYSLKDWESLLKSNGLVVNAVIRENSHLANLGESSSYVKYFCKLLANPFVRFLPLNLSYNFIFLCKKDTNANI